MTLSDLKQQVYEANLDLMRHGLVLFTWGNASALDRERGCVVIKPSGIPYDAMQPEDMVVVDLLTGNPVESRYKPSSDTPTHLELYRSMPEIGGIVHTHSTYSTSWAQSGVDLPPLGTTHADHFYGAIPCISSLTESKIKEDYERNIGRLIVLSFQERRIRPLEVPATLLQGHGAFCWGPDVHQAVYHAVVLEAVAKMATLTLQINPAAKPISQILLDKHFFRKHGKDAYYGQDN